MVARIQQLLRIAVFSYGALSCTAEGGPPWDQHPPTTEPLPPPPSDSSHDDDGAPLESSTQSWGIGAEWYDYGSNHSVSPKDISWLIVRDEGNATHLRVDGFYSDRGVSSTPSMTFTHFIGGERTPPKAWLSPTRIRDEFQCLRVEDLSQSFCGSAYDLIWRTDFRAIPRAGFSISNPAFYVETSRGERVYQLASRDVPTSISIAAAAGQRVVSVLDQDASPLLKEAFFSKGYSVTQLTGDLHIAEWTLSRSEDDSVLIQARCVQAKPTPADTSPLHGPPAHLYFAAPAEGQWIFVDLCSADGPRVSFESENLRAGGWPSNDRFDLALQSKNGQLHLWPAPESIFTPQRVPAFTPKDMPRVYWQD